MLDRRSFLSNLLLPAAFGGGLVAGGEAMAIPADGPTKTGSGTPSV